MAVFAVFMQQVNLGIIGAGTVGGGVYQAIQRNGGLMASRLGVRFEIVRMAARDLKKPRPVTIPKSLLTKNWKAVVEDPRVQIVVELMGGTTTAREVTLPHEKRNLAARRSTHTRHRLMHLLSLRYSLPGCDFRDS